jgi:DNA-binding transcriptional ArsR family regulator
MDVGPIFYALSDPTRRAIFESVRHGARSVSDIAADFQVSRPAVSQHLRVLAEAGLVQQHRSGRNNFYALDLSGVAALRTYLEGFWSDVLTAFQAAANVEAKKNKGKGH